MDINNQWETFLSYENFKLAFKRLQTTGKTLYKDIYRKEMNSFGTFLDENIMTLIHKIETNMYAVKNSYKYYMPKKDFSIRPITCIHFIDLLVYQAIANIISEVFYDTFSPLYGKFIFGNILNKPDSENNIFFYKPWKKQWKDFNYFNNEYFEDDYIYLSEFDIASFFDTINHKILEQMLIEYGVEKKLIDKLLYFLEKVTYDSERKTYLSSTGIPQGPISSSLFADIYLLYIDKHFIELTNKQNPVLKYIRYVDDIRIYTKDRKTGEKYLKYIDLLSRDIGLVPQTSKILTHEINDNQKLISRAFNNFSRVSEKFKKNDYSLKSKDHNRLKKKFLECLSTENETIVFDKTVFSFSLYKLNKDEKIKTFLLSNYKTFLFNMDPALYYLSKYYSSSKDVISFISKLLKKEGIYYNFIHALIFCNFSKLEFNSDIYIKFYNDKKDNWLARYYMIDWLYENKQDDLLRISLDDERNSIVKLKLESTISKLIDQKDIRKFKLDKIIINKTDHVSVINAMQDYSDLIFNYIFGLKNSPEKDQCNIFASNIIYDYKDDYISYTLEEKFHISRFSHTLSNIDLNKDEQKELDFNFFNFIHKASTEPDVSIVHLNNFNEILTVGLAKTFKENKDNQTYGVLLSSLKLFDNFNHVRNTFILVNDSRNSKSISHTYDKDNNIKINITYNQLDKIINKECDALKEINSYFCEN